MYYTSFLPGVNPFHKILSKNFVKGGLGVEDVLSGLAAVQFGQLGDGSCVLDAADGALAVDLIAAVAGQTGALRLGTVLHPGDKVGLTDQGAAERDEGDVSSQHLPGGLEGENTAHKGQRHGDTGPGLLQVRKIEGLLNPHAGGEIHAADLGAVHTRLLKQLQQPVEVSGAVGVQLHQNGEVLPAGLTYCL